MKPITPETPRKNITVGGVIFSAPTPYAEGDTLNANEAAAINQTYLENLGNNFRARVNKAVRLAMLGKTEAKPEELKAITDKAVKTYVDDEANSTVLTKIASDLAGDFNTLVTDYKMGARRVSSVTAYSPEEKAARAIAKDKLKAALVKRGTKLNTVSADWYEREIGKLLDREHPKMNGEKNVTEDIWTTAARQVKLLQQSASETLDDLDVSGIEKPAKEAAAAAEAENITGNAVEGEAKTESKPGKKGK